MERIFSLVGILSIFNLLNASTFISIVPDGDIVVLLGETIQIKCTVDEFGSNPFAFLKGSVMKSMGENSFDDRIVITTEVNGLAKSFIHTINNAVLDDEDTYTCQTPKNGETQEYKIVINIPATISVVDQETLIEAPVDTSVLMQCEADGKPMPVIKWHREGQSLPSGEDELTSNSLKLENIQKDDGGVYICSADNGFGEPASQSISITTIYPPTVTTQFTESVIQSNLGENHKFTCSFEGSPAVQVSWKQDDGEININDRSNIKISSNTVDTLSESSLEITQLTEKDYGLYTCIGGNSEGQEDASIEIDGTPYDLKIISSGISDWADEYIVIWTMESPLPPLDYSLQFYKYPEYANEGLQEEFNGANGEGSGEVEPVVEPEEPEDREAPTMIGEYTISPISSENNPYKEEYLLEDLEAGKDYLIVLQGRNSLGHSERAQFPFKAGKVFKPIPTTTEKITTAVPTTEAITTEEITTQEILALTSTPAITTMTPLVEKSDISKPDVPPQPIVVEDSGSVMGESKNAGHYVKASSISVIFSSLILMVVFLTKC